MGFFETSPSPTSLARSTAWFLRRRDAVRFTEAEDEESQRRRCFFDQPQRSVKMVIHHTLYTLKLNSIFFAPESMMGFPSSEFLRVWKRGLIFFWCELLVSGRVLFMYRHQQVRS